METWKDIVEDMKSFAARFKNELDGEIVDGYADRIEAACKTLEDVLIVEQEENAKLRRALEPVMDVSVDAILNSNVDATTLLASIVKEAKAILKEGAK